MIMLRHVRAFLMCLLVFRVTIVQSCVMRSHGFGNVVCVCTRTQCGALLLNASKLSRPAIINGFDLYTSSKAGMRLHHSVGFFSAGYPSKPAGSPEKIQIVVDASISYQSIHGFGGAMSDAVGIHLQTLRPETKNLLLRALFGADGNAYSLVRVEVGGADTSPNSRKYPNGDSELKHFRLTASDLKYKIPTLVSAGELSEGRLRVVAALPIRGQRQTDSHLLLLHEYARLGVPVWAVAITASLTQRIDWLVWPPAPPIRQREWLGRCLGPALRNSSTLGATLLFAVFDQRLMLLPPPRWADRMFEDSEVRRYVDGIFVHWYWNVLNPHPLLEEMHDRHPDKIILSAKGINVYGKSSWNVKRAKLGCWGRAEKHVADMLQGANSWVSGWAESPLLAGMWGRDANSQDAGVIVDPLRDQFLLQPSYYALAHFSRFLPPGSRRVKLLWRRTTSQENVNAAAFLAGMNDTVAVIIQNRRDADVEVTVRDPRQGVASFVLPARSFNTMVYHGDDATSKQLPLDDE